MSTSTTSETADDPPFWNTTPGYVVIGVCCGLAFLGLTSVLVYWCCWLGKKTKQANR